MMLSLGMAVSAMSHADPLNHADPLAAAVRAQRQAQTVQSSLGIPVRVVLRLHIAPTTVVTYLKSPDAGVNPPS
jgi:hypothetical protein